MSSITYNILTNARRSPDRLAACFLDEKLNRAQTLTCGELTRCSMGIAERLSLLAKAGDVVLLLYPAGLEFVAAFLGALMVGVVPIPAPAQDAIRAKRTLPRLHGILEDARPTLVMTSDSQRRHWTEAVNMLARACPCGAIYTGLSESASAAFDPPVSGADQLAYLQYTSGSTSQPRGVMVTHGNVLENCEHISRILSFDADSVMVNWLPHFHDFGLVEGILLPLLEGAPTYLLSPACFLKHPLLWLKAMDQYRATHSQAPNFAFDLCLKAASQDPDAAPDLSSVRKIVMGGEPVRPETIDGFNACFAHTGLSPLALTPGYGLAEATLALCAWDARDGERAVTLDRRELARHRVRPAADGRGVPVAQCGRPFANLRVRIVNPETLEVCGRGEIGEIWVGGPSVAPGYLGRSAESAAVFAAQVVGDCTEGPFLRTGDLGFLMDGSLYITGRLKNMLIIHGENRYPQDLELAAREAHPICHGHSGAAFALDGETDVEVVLAQEVTRVRSDEAEIYADAAEAIRVAVAEICEVSLAAVVLLRRGSLPKTSSNKIQHSQARDSYLRGELGVLYLWQRPTAPVDAGPAEGESVELLLHRLFCAALKLPDIDRDAHFFALGGDSVDFADLCARVEEKLRVSVPMNILCSDPTIAGFLRVMQAAAQLPDVVPDCASRPCGEWKAQVRQRIRALLPAWLRH